MIRVLSLFSGIGAFEKGLENLGVEHEVVNYCEIDPYAGKAYSLIHGVDESKNLVDVTTIDTSKLKDIDLVTYGFPCQDISIAGKQKGFEDEEGNTTRSSLFFEALRIIQDTKPKYAIAENVKNLMSKSFERELDIVLNSLGAAGYNNYCKVLNAKDYGIPQNRERVFIVSIRRDIDDYAFEFPQAYTLELRMKDLLEKAVDEKYYMSDKALNTILATGTNNFYAKPEIDLEVTRTLTATMHKSHRASEDNYVSDAFVNHDIKLDIENGKPVIGKHLEPVRLGNIYGEDKGTGYAGNVWDKDAIAPTLMTMQGGNRQPMIIDDIYASREPRVYEEYAPTHRASNCGELKVAEPVIDKVDDKLEITYPDEPFIVASRGRYGEGQKILVKENTKQGYAEAYEGDSINLEQPNLKTRRGRIGHGVAQTLTNFTPARRSNQRKSYYYWWNAKKQAIKRDGICTTLTSSMGTGGGYVPMLVEEPKIEEPKKLFNLYPKNGQAGNVYDENCCSPCLPGFGGGGGEKELKVLHDLRIRKLTPKECFRLMGFDDKDIDILIENGISNTQLYKMAGNSIVVNVLMAIFNKLLIDRTLSEPDLFSEFVF